MGFDAIIIGSGFGGSVAACRFAEAGMRVLVLERGRRWDNQPGPGVTPYPRAPGDPWVWDQQRPETWNGWLDLRLFRGMAVAQGAAVGGGSLIYASISAEAPAAVFDRGWPAEINRAELQPFYDRVAEFMDVQFLPANQWNPRIQLMQQAAGKIGAGNRFRPLPIAVNFDPRLQLDPEHPPALTDTVYKANRHGVTQGTCVHTGACDIGCPVKAKNTLDLNYLAVAERHAAEVRPLHLVRHLERAGGGYRVSFDRLEGGRRIPGHEDAAIVIVAAGSLGSTELLLRCRDEVKTLPGLSRRLGRNWSCNGDFLVPAFYRDREMRPEVGPTISSAIDYLDRSRNGQSFWVQDGGLPPVFRHHAQAAQASQPGVQAGSHPFEALIRWLQGELRHADPIPHIMPWFAQGVDAGNGQFQLRRPWLFFGQPRLNLQWESRASQPLFQTIVDTHRELSHSTGGVPLASPFWKEWLVTPHPLGGCGMGRTAADGVVAHTGEVFGYQNLFVLDGSMVPTPLGVNPSRTIAALAERCAAMIVRHRRPGAGVAAGGS